MPDALATSDFIAHRKALRAAATAIELVLRVPAPLKPIADQVIRGLVAPQRARRRYWNPRHVVDD